MLINDWIPTFWNVLNVKQNTLKEYKRLYTKNVLDFIGTRHFDEVTSIELQTSLLRHTPQNAKHLLMLLKSLYREAIFHQVAKNNPTLGLKTQKIQITSRKFLTWEEIDELDWGKYNNQVRFVALHGLRWSEAVVITENDIRDGYVWVNKSIYGDVKSKSSNRRIPYLGFFAPLPKSYKPFRKAVNQHGITVHSLRRTYAYLLKTKGVHVTTAQKLLGHSDPMMTLKVYTSVLDSEIFDVGEMLKDSLTKKCRV